MKKVIFIPFLFALGACAFIPDFYSDRPAERNSFKMAKTYPLSGYTKYRYLGEHTVQEKNYQLDERMFSRIGEKVITVRSLRHREHEHDYNVFELPQDIKVTFGIENFTMPAKEYHVLGTVDLEDGRFLVLDSPFKYHLLMNEDGTLSTHPIYEHSQGTYYLPFERITFSPRSPRLNRKSKISRETEMLSEYEISYDGIKDNKLIFLYKNAIIGANEGSGSFVVLTFPADAEVINLKGHMMRIIRADEDHIEYVMVKGYY